MQIITQGGRPLAKHNGNRWFRVSAPAWGEVSVLVYEPDEARVRATFWTDRAELRIEATDLSWEDGYRLACEEAAPTSDGGSAGSAPVHPRAAEVTKWLRAYEGRNRFVLDVQAKFLSGKAGGRSKAKKLTVKQVEALAKAKDREAQWAEERKAEAVNGFDLRAAIPEGTIYAAAENAEGTLSFVKIDHVAEGKWAGWVFVKGVTGSDLRGFKVGSQHPESNAYRGQWEEVLRNVAADVEAAVIRFGTEIGTCGVCGRALTNEESREAGIGPVCAGKFKGA